MLTLIPILMTLCLIKSIQYSKQSHPLTHAIYSETSFYDQEPLSAIVSLFLDNVFTFRLLCSTEKNNEDTKIYVVCSGKTLACGIKTNW